jgi:hypothetical protein
LLIDFIESQTNLLWNLNRQMFGGPKNTMGLLVLAAYLQSKRGPKLQR